MATVVFEMPNRLDEITKIIAQFEEFAEKSNVPMDVIMKMNLVFDDILSNVVQYAYTDKGNILYLWIARSMKIN